MKNQVEQLKKIGVTVTAMGIDEEAVCTVSDICTFAIPFSVYQPLALQSLAYENSRPSSLPATRAGSEEGRLFSQAMQSLTPL